MPIGLLLIVQHVRNYNKLLRESSKIVFKGVITEKSIRTTEEAL
jgi:hypothetical protein